MRETRDAILFFVGTYLGLSLLQRSLNWLRPLLAMVIVYDIYKRGTRVITRRVITVTRFGRGARSPQVTSMTGKTADHTVEVSGVALDVLTELAEQQGVTLGTVLAEAIAVQKAIADEKAKGTKVVFKRNGRAPRELVVA